MQLRSRIVVPVASAFLVGCVVAWTWATTTGRIGYAGPLLDPVAWDGREVTLSLAEVVAVEPGAFVVGKGALRVRVEGPTDGLVPGIEVDVGGTWRADRRAVVQEWRSVAVGREGKRRLGVLGLLVVALILPLGVTRSAGGLALRG